MGNRRNTPARNHMLRQVRRQQGDWPRRAYSVQDDYAGTGDSPKEKLHPLFIFRRSPRRGLATPGRIAVLLFFALMLAIPLSLFGAISGGAAATYSYFSSTLPSLDTMQTLNFETTKIYDRNGVLLYEIFDKVDGKRTNVSLAEISPWVMKATIATEDASFYSNPGVDLKGIARAVYIEYFSSGSSGGSTITQQLVRAVLLRDQKSERTYSRKIREALLSLEFSKRYTKDQILEMYLNEIFYGNLAYGIEAASQIYFGKQAKDLDLAEASLLAGLPQAPSTYDPMHNLDRAKKRQEIVLGLMAKQGYITEEEAQQAYDEELHFIPPSTQEKILAPHFVHYVQQLLEQKYGSDLVNRGGLTVYTSIDLRYQAIAEKVAKDHIATLAASHVTNAALVAMKPKTGEILAMVGSVDYYNDAIDGQVNVATAERQPGSSFKPIAYSTAFKKGWSPGIMVSDAPLKIDIPGQPPYQPKNYDGKFRGWMTLRTALSNSYNIPAVKVLQYAGLHDTILTAHDLGITSLQDESRYGPSLVLGGGEVKLVDLTNAYSVFASGGEAVTPQPILKVLDTNGKVLEELDPSKPQEHRALTEQIAYEITSILSDNKARATMFGLNSPLQLSRPAAAKTGTTNDYRDGWTMGYTPYLVTGVWAGNSDNTEMKGEPGVQAAGPIWHNFMEAVFARPDLEPVLRDNPNTPLQKDFVQPGGMVKKTICGETGLLATKACPHPSTDIMPASQAPTEYCKGPHAYTPAPRPTATATPTSTATPDQPAATPAPQPATDQPPAAPKDNGGKTAVAPAPVADQPAQPQITAQPKKKKK
jgi:1A family penicillin-binding protein